MDRIRFFNVQLFDGSVAADDYFSFFFKSTQFSEILSRIVRANSWLRFFAAFLGEEAFIGFEIVFALREPFLRGVFFGLGM